MNDPELLACQLPTYPAEDSRMADDDDPSTKREVPVKKAWMAQTAAATVAPPEPTLGISVFDPPEQRFAETGELGRGGMGRVVEALDRALGRSVAIKQSLATSSVDLARFEREARITAQLQHPSVVPILDVGRDAEGKPFYVMRKIEGVPLAQRVDEAETIGDRLALLSSLLGAIDAAAYAHARKIIHRDIKPWNILLGPFGETLLIDWGIARELDTEDLPGEQTSVAAADTRPVLTKFGRAYGTPGFLSPEQARGEPVDARADVYSLGATLYYVLAGKVPFGVDDPTAAIEAAASDESPDFEAIPEDVPNELRAIAIKALAPKPADRYADAGELAADIRRFLAGQLVAAHEYTARERIAKWIGRHKVAVAIGTLAVIAIAAVSVVSIRQVIHDRDAASNARDLAEKRADENLVDRARMLASTDPTSAIATLRELPPESASWAAVRAITRTAILSGVERRVAKHPTRMQALEFSPDGARLASASSEIQICDLATRESKTIPLDVEALRWRDERTLVYLREVDTHFEVGLLDIENPMPQRLAVATPVQIEIAGNRVLVRGERGAVVAIAPDRSLTTLADAGILDIAVAGPKIALLGPTEITLLDGDTRRVILHGETLELGKVQLSPDGNRLAVSYGGNVREWQLGRQTPPEAWTNFAEVAYAGSTLYGWHPAYGFSSLDAKQPVPRHITKDVYPGILQTHIVPFDGGALLTDDRAGLVHVDANGPRAFAHRPLAINRAAIDRTGTHIAIASGFDILLTDLSPAVPPSIPVPHSAELLGMLGDKALLRIIALPEDPPGFTEGLVLYDVVKRESRVLDRRRMNAYVMDELVVANPDRQPYAKQFWTEDGTLIARVDDARIAGVKGNAAIWFDHEGAAWRQSPGGQPTLLGRIPRELVPEVPNYGSKIVKLLIDDNGPIVGVYHDARIRYLRIAGGAAEEVPLGVPIDFTTLAGRASNGAWYSFTFEPNGLWKSVDGKAERIPVEHEVANVWVKGDRVLVIMRDGVVTELDLDHRIVREVSTQGGPAAVAGDNLVVPTQAGLDVVGPSTVSRGTLRIPGKLGGVHANARHIAAIAKGDSGVRLVVWTDQVPDDPAALRAYLDKLTNARLPTGSDALRWDP